MTEENVHEEMDRAVAKLDALLNKCERIRLVLNSMAENNSDFVDSFEVLERAMDHLEEARGFLKEAMET